MKPSDKGAGEANPIGGIIFSVLKKQPQQHMKPPGKGAGEAKLAGGLSLSNLIKIRLSAWLTNTVGVSCRRQEPESSIFIYDIHHARRLRLRRRPSFSRRGSKKQQEGFSVLKK